jgi:iron complex outermembrane receptor protein
MTQRLASDDRIAFPFGCSAEGRFDRYCSDGSVDLYDFRSEGERRRTDALDLALEGQAALGASRHHVAIGALVTRHRAELPPQAFNFAGVGTLDGRVVVPEAPLPLFDVASRNERSRELYWRDRIEFERGLLENLSLWLGLRHTRLEREARQSFTTPWVAATWRFAPNVTAYASWGQGVETEVVPALALYTNAARALPALKSRQVEGGIKLAHDALDASLALFSIARPMTGDSGACDADASCTRVIDGEARHRGAEATLAWRGAAWGLQGGVMLLDASRRAGADASLNGLQPTNVPRHSLRFDLTRRIGADAQVQASLAHEGPRAVLPDNSIRIGGWTRIDFGAKIVQGRAATRITWRAAIENLTDRRAWKESPTQFSHAYLFPLAPRSLRLSAQLEL